MTWPSAQHCHCKKKPKDLVVKLPCHHVWRKGRGGPCAGKRSAETEWAPKEAGSRTCHARRSWAWPHPSPTSLCNHQPGISGRGLRKIKIKTAKHCTLSTTGRWIAWQKKSAPPFYVLPHLLLTWLNIIKKIFASSVGTFLSHSPHGNASQALSRMINDFLTVKWGPGKFLLC